MDNGANLCMTGPSREFRCGQTRERPLGAPVSNLPRHVETDAAELQRWNLARQTTFGR